MSERDELADLMKVIHDVHHGDCTNPDECIDGIYTDEETAMAILARWRLVPVEDAPADQPVIDMLSDMAKAQAKAQHRAAGELTRHDQDAGHYGVVPEHPRPCSTCNHEPPPARR